MAQPATTRRLSPKGFWKLVVEPTPGRAEFALRLTLICTLSAVVAETYTTPEAALTTYLAFFLCKPSRTVSILTSVAFTVIVVAVIGLLFLLASPALASTSGRLATMALASFVMLFLASSSKLKPMGATIAIVVTAALGNFGAVPFGEVVTRSFLYALLFIGIPAACTIGVNLFLGPAPLKLAQREFAERLHVAAEAIHMPMLEVGKRNNLLGAGDAESLADLKMAKAEGELVKSDLGVLQGAADCIVTMLSAVNLMLQEPAALPAEETRTAISRRLIELADIFQRGEYPVNVDSVPLNAESTEPASQAVELFNQGLARLGQERPPSDKERKSSFFLSDAFNNPEHVQFALKTTAAAMFCYLTYSILDWTGIHTSMITVYIVSLGSVAETVEKLTLRIIGCLIGAGLGLLTMLYIIPNATDVGHLAVIVACGVLIGAWIAAGSPRIGYVGFQVAFAFLLCVIQGPAPMHKMEVARDRVVGILFGNAVSYIVSTQFWPASIKPRIDAAIGDVQKKLAGIAAGGNPWKMSRMNAELHELILNAKEQILLVGYEPRSVRPDKEWIEALNEFFLSVENLEAPLFCSVQMGSAGDRHRIAEQLNESSVFRTEADAENSIASRRFLQSNIENFHRCKAELNEVSEHA